MTVQLIEKYGDKLATTSVEVQVANTNGSYYLPDDAILRDKKVLGWFVMPNESGSAVSPTGRDIVSEAAINSSYLTIKFLNDDVISQHPLSDFRPNKEDREIRYFTFCGLNPSKSFIEVGDTSLIAAGESFMLQFLYLNE